MRVRLVVSALAAVAAVVIAGAAFAATPKRAPVPTSCTKFLPVSVVEAKTGLQITSVTQSYGHMGATAVGIGCYYHDADFPADPKDPILNHVLELTIWSEPHARSLAYLHRMEAAAAASYAKYGSQPPCTPGSNPPPRTPSVCTVLHPFGVNSVEWNGVGLVVVTDKYRLTSLTTQNDTWQEGIVGAALARLPK